MGSTRSARRVGIVHAASALMAKSRPAATKVTGSLALTW
jgi:hypothetical protein